MHKKLLFLILIAVTTVNIYAQKFAYVDTDYILNKLPEFKQAQDKLDQISLDWQKEIEQKYEEVERMYRTYQQEKILLTEKMRLKREEAIIKKENETKQQEHKYFGPNGDLFLKRQELIQPIQDRVYDAIQQLAGNNKYAIIFDSSSDLIMLYKNNNFDKSDKVLELLGY